MINIITEQNIQITITNSLKILWNQYFVKQTHTIKEKKIGTMASTTMDWDAWQI